MYICVALNTYISSLVYYVLPRIKVQYMSQVMIKKQLLINKIMIRTVVSLLILLLAILILSTMDFDLAIFTSSEHNRKIAEREYSDSMLEKFIATKIGDEFPTMRDDLIRRKHNGEGILTRHYNAWTTWSNWNWKSKDED